MVSEYIFSGSLPESATTYVTREADHQLLSGLKSGKFCYVLNSRQTGKSSLRVRTQRHLTNAGFACASIDLSSDGVQQVTQQQWYVGIIDTLIDQFDLDLDLEKWWSQRQLLSDLKHFRKFIEEILLVEIQQPIVIFIDEIDSVLSLNFPTDDFFAFIRACHNQRADNGLYNRLTFCLLGVASPSNLIEDKKRTPFNIGQAIRLTGFRLGEVEPLIQGLVGKISDYQAVMKEILAWTGGQPFLTQKLCQLMVIESEKKSQRSVKQVVRELIIDNWEAQDEPEHLRTIRDHLITRDEQKAGYLLELYQQIWLQGAINSNNSSEQSELKLSGLVIQQEGKLCIYNRIYQEVFNQDWIEQQLSNLRPYSESFRAWVVSGCTDESRLLRGQALQDAILWSNDKSLSFQDRQFLAASKEKEIEVAIAQKESEAKLERERKNREAAEKAFQIEAQANREAQQKLSIAKRRSTIVVSLACLVAGILAAFAVIATKQVYLAKNEIEEIRSHQQDLSTLAELAKRLERKGKTEEAQQARAKVGLAYQVREELEDRELTKALLFTSIAKAHQHLEEFEKAQIAINNTLEILKNKEDINSSAEGIQIKVLAKSTIGSLLTKTDTTKARAAYKKAFQLLQNYPNQTNSFKDNKTLILTPDNITSIHTGLMNLLYEEPKFTSLLKETRNSLKNHYFSQLENYLNPDKEQDWAKADRLTVELMLLIANREKEGFFLVEDIETFNCQALRKIDRIWLDSSNGNLGLSVQTSILKSELEKEGLDLHQLTIESFLKDTTWLKYRTAYWRFSGKVRWYNEQEMSDIFCVITYKELIDSLWDESGLIVAGHFPYLRGFFVPLGDVYLNILELWESAFPIRRGSLTFRTVTCNL